jgi:transposase
MATERLSMRKTKEILRQKWTLGRTNREIACSVSVSAGSVGKTVSRAKAVKLDWAQVQQLDEQRLYGLPTPPIHNRPLPSMEYIHQEMHKKGVTLQLLHIEYLEGSPDGYKYTQFCEYYRQWQVKRRLVMRQSHRAGEKIFVDYSGKKPYFTDQNSGECIEVELFVAVVGASNYTYAEATRTQKVPDWIASHIRALEYFGGVSDMIVPDQLRSAVSRPCRYEPGIQRTYQEMGEHYGTAIVPARPGKPRDKAKVEVGVQIAQRWVLARLRNQTFFSLAELNERIFELIEQLNSRIMRVYGKSRKQLFEELDKPAFRPLPERRFVYGQWKIDVGVNIDYHIEIDFHYYSVPYQLMGEQVDVKQYPMTLEVYYKSQRVASHLRSFKRGGFTTKTEHMPKAHREHMKWSPSRLIRWGATIGPNTSKLIEAILNDRPHPEQGYRSCLGILRLGKQYGPERLESACGRALWSGGRNFRHVDAILKNGLDRLPVGQPPAAPCPPVPVNDNVRGAAYYAQPKE